MAMSEEVPLSLSECTPSDSINEVKLSFQNLLQTLIDTGRDDISFAKAAEQVLHGNTYLNKEDIISFAKKLIQLHYPRTFTRSQAQPRSGSVTLSGQDGIWAPRPLQKRKRNDTNTNSGWIVTCTTTTGSIKSAPNFALTEQPSSFGRHHSNTVVFHDQSNVQVPRTAFDIVLPLNPASKEIIIKTRSTHGIKVNGVRLQAAPPESDFCLSGYLQTGDVIEIFQSEQAMLQYQCVIYHNGFRVEKNPTQMFEAFENYDLQQRMKADVDARNAVNRKASLNFKRLRVS